MRIAQNACRERYANLAVWEIFQDSGTRFAPASHNASRVNSVTTYVSTRNNKPGNGNNNTSLVQLHPSDMARSSACYFLPSYGAPAVPTATVGRLTTEARRSTAVFRGSPIRLTELTIRPAIQCFCASLALATLNRPAVRCNLRACFRHIRFP